jgi:hypothetical protein
VTLEQVEVAAQTVRAATDALRQEVVAAVASKHPITAVASAAGITRPTVYAWMKAADGSR